MRIGLNWDFGYISESLVGFRTHPDTITRAIGSEQGVTSAGPDLVLLYSEVNFQQRTEFIGEAPLEPRRKQRLHALATLYLIAESAWALPWREVAVRMGKLVRTYPRILLHARSWRIIAAQLGGRRARAALRRMWTPGARTVEAD